MGTNRSGRSPPAGPATIPHASSGWSRLACATIASRTSLATVSTRPGYPPRPSRPAGSVEAADQRLLQPAQPVVELECHPRRVSRVERGVLRGPVLVHVEPRAEREPQVVEDTEPGRRRALVEAVVGARLVEGGDRRAGVG